MNTEDNKPKARCLGRLAVDRVVVAATIVDLVDRIKSEAPRILEQRMRGPTVVVMTTEAKQMLVEYINHTYNLIMRRVPVADKRLTGEGLILHTAAGSLQIIADDYIFDGDILIAGIGDITPL